MNNTPEITKQDADMAQFRFALIAPVVQGLFPDSSATAYYKRVTEKPLTLPDGSTVQYSYKTLEKWKSMTAAVLTHSYPEGGPTLVHPASLMMKPYLKSTG